MSFSRDFSLFRPKIIIPTLTGIYTIAAHAYNDAAFFTDPLLLKTFLTGELSLLFLLCGGYLMNDCCDVEHDLINRPETVYIGKKISALAAALLATVLFALSIVTAFFINKAFVAVICAQIAALVLYNLFSKRISFAKPILISLLLISIYPLTFALTGGGIPSPRRDSLFVFPVWLFFSVISYELMADAADAAGDVRESSGYISALGGARAVSIGRWIAGLSAPIALIPFAAGMCHWVYGIGACLSLLVLYAALAKKNADIFRALHIYIVGVIIASIADIAVMP